MIKYPPNSPRNKIFPYSCILYYCDRLSGYVHSSQSYRALSYHFMEGLKLLILTGGPSPNCRIRPNRLEELVCNVTSWLTFMESTAASPTFTPVTRFWRHQNYLPHLIKLFLLFKHEIFSDLDGEQSHFHMRDNKI